MFAKQKIKWGILLAVIHLFLCIISGSWGWNWQTVIVPVTSILAMAVAGEKLGFSPAACLAVVMPFYLFYISASLMVDAEYATYPIWIFGLLASLFTFLFLKYRITPAVSIIILSLIILLDGLVVWPNVFAWTLIKNEPARYQPFNAQLVDINNQLIPAETFKGKIVLLDIWHSACYPCVKKFPALQELYDSYKNDTMIKIAALNIPLERDEGIRPSRFTDPYTFDKLYFLNQKEYQKFLDRSVPLVLILDKKGQCRYAGELNTSPNIFIGNSRLIINQLKNE